MNYKKNVKKQFILFILYEILFNSIFCSFIIIPFQTEQINQGSLNFIQSKFDINLHTYLELGKPKQKIKIFFRDEFFSFFIIDTNTTYNEEETNNNKIPPENIKLNINSFYNSKSSSTYKNTSEYKNFFIDIYYRKGYLSKETFYFKTNNISDLMEYNNLDFVLVNKIKPNRTLLSGCIGLLVEEYFLEGAQSFVRMLAKNNVTSSNIWTKKYYNDKKGYFIFGDYPHEYEKNIYHKEQYIETDIKYNTYIQKWNLEFEEIFFRIGNKNNDLYINEINNNVYLNFTLYGEIKHNLGLIIGTVEYQKLIEEFFFNYYIDKNICFKEKMLLTIHNDDKANYTYYFCQNNNLFYKEKFPTLYLNQKSLKYIFELNENNLFILNDNKWYFMIIFEGEEIANPLHKWIFGEPFLKKYNFVFDPINYKLGFYNPLIPYSEQKEKSKKEISNNNNQILFFGLILLFSFVCIFLIYSYFCQKIQFFNKKISNSKYIELDNLPLNDYKNSLDKKI